MKIDGKGQPPSVGASVSDNDANPLDKVGGKGADKADGPSDAGRAFAEKLARPLDAAPSGGSAGPTSALGRVQSPEGGAAAAPVPGSEIGVSDLAASLRAGGVTAREAIDQLLDRVVTRQLGPNAPAITRDQVRAALQDAIDNDPLLAEKLRRLP